MKKALPAFFINLPYTPGAHEHPDLPRLPAGGRCAPVTLLWLVARRAWRQLAVADAYRLVARGLGLQVDTRGVSVSGHLDGRRMYVGAVLVGHGTHRSSEYRGILTLARPLGLGLLIRPRKSRRWLRRRARAEKVQTTDERFDRLFEVFGDDEQRIRTLLDSSLLATIIAFAERWPELVITDHHIRVALRRPESTAADLGALVDGIRRLADALVKHRRDVEPAHDLGSSVATWESLANTLGLEVEPWFPGLAGTFEGRSVVVTPRREESGFASQIVVGLKDHRDLGFRLTPQTRPDGYWSVGQDIQVRDPEFDTRFVIKGYDPNAIRTLLGQDARARLLSLAGRGMNVDMDDLRLRVRQGPLDHDDIASALRDAVAAADALGW